MMQRAEIIRLEHYLARLREIRSAGRSTLTSDDLAGSVGVTASRVRQDMMRLRLVGKPRSGYDIDELERCIHDELDLVRPKGMVVVGCGNLARALINSGIWANTGFALCAAFDNDRRKVGSQIGRLTVRHVSEMPQTIRNRHITAACLTVPESAAQSVVDTLVQSGIRGIWNFASSEVRVPPGIALENQSLEQGLMTLSYLMKERRHAGGEGPDTPTEVTPDGRDP
jgi:redox-sensing transcriptional repressor